MTRGAWALRALVALILAAAALAAGVGPASADGDPGSDVLIYQSLFVGSDAGISVPAQIRLGALLQASARAQVPIRVAIVAHRDDLGSVTGLWRRPQAYAHFLGYELSLGYRGRLIVVMPNGFGVDWPHHETAAASRALAAIAVGPSGAALAAATQTAVRVVAGEAGVRLALPALRRTTRAPARRTPAVPTITGFSATPKPRPAPVPAATPTRSTGAATDRTVALVAILVLGLVLLLTFLARRRAAIFGGRARSRAAAAVVLLAALAIAGLLLVRPDPPTSNATALALNPALDPGTVLSGAPAPNFTLTDQRGRPVSLRSFRGKVTLLDFNDAECTTICPLTTTAMLDAKRMLGGAGREVQLLGVNANPKATSIEDTVSYTQLHGLVGRWQFLTGSLSQLRSVWHAYGIQASIQRGLISHTPALYLIDRDGRLRRLYMTQQSYGAVGQFGQILARAISAFLPGHPAVRSRLGYTPAPAVTPRRATTLPVLDGPRLSLGPGRARLYLFFDTWDREVTPLAGDLDALNAYAAEASRAGLPALAAIDEGAVEPSPQALPQFLKTLPAPLRYPVALDATGDVADGYQVQGAPWLVLVSATGRIVWYDAVNTSRWPTVAALRRQVRAALAPSLRSSAPTPAQLIDSPAPLAALHRQAGKLLGGGDPGLEARIRALRGYPIVVNLWASWCGPCQAEFSLFASASQRFGRQVAFLGVNTEDPSPADAAAFLRAHPVSYPSYRSSEAGLGDLLTGGVEGLPTTVFIGRDGRVSDVHTGQYDSQGTLDADIASDALRAG